MRSLRGRLTIGVTLVLAAVLAVAGTIASRYVHRSEREAVDDRLERTAELSRATALAAVEQQLPEDDRRLDAVLSATGTALRLRLGHVVLLDTGRPPPSRPRLPLGLSTFTTRDGRRYRAYATTLRDPGLGGLARQEVTTSLAPLESRLSALDRRLLALGALAILVAGLGTWLAADLVLRPLRRLRAATAGIAHDDDLHRAVPARDGPAELRALAEDFNAMLARLGRSAADRERALAATRRFAADAGHELRTPLTSLEATLSAISRHPEIPQARRTAMVDDALVEHSRLVDLLDGLQALARGDALGVPRDAVDLADVAATAAERTARRHPDVDVVTELPESAAVVEGWEPGLRLLADNLLENAARHGRPGGRIRATVLAAGGGHGARLVVDDDGPGVPEAERERIFEPFARVDGHDRPGSGLGLALVAQQARHHGARVDVERSAMGGARFVVAFADTADRGAGGRPGERVRLRA